MAGARRSMFDRLLFGPEFVTSSRQRLSDKKTEEVQKSASPLDQDVEKTWTSAGAKEVLCTPSTSSESDFPQRASFNPRKTPNGSSTWCPRILQRQAILGLAALCTTVGCIFASLAVLVASDGKAVEDWNIPPSVYIAIATAIANLSLGLARLEAVPISWWYSISRGRSIESLERQWQVSRSFIQAARHARHMSLLNMACIAGALVAVDGPFLQRASTVRTAEIVSPVNLNVTLMPELPTGFTGILQYGAVDSPLASLNLLPDYATRAPMHISHSPRCDGACYATVLAPGVQKTHCSSRTWPITYETLHSANASWGPWGQEGKNRYGIAHLPIYHVDVERNYRLPSEAAKITTGIASWDNWQGSYVETVCFLVPAILEYDVRIENNTISINGDAASARFVSFANNTKPVNATTEKGYRTSQNDTMDAITESVRLLSQANGKAFFESGQKSWTWQSTTYNLEVFRHQVWPSRSSASLAFKDPMPSVIEHFNQLFFRGATMTSTGSPPWQDPTAWIDPGLQVHQVITSRQVSHKVVFHSDLSWYAAAAVVELVAVCLISMMFWGWWTLGCDFNLSPLAVALAFDTSSILGDLDSPCGSRGSRGVVDEVGDIRIKFGVLNQSNQGSSRRRRIGIGRIADISTPEPGQSFSE